MRAPNDSGEREAAYAERDTYEGSAWPGAGRPLAVLPDAPLSGAATWEIELATAGTRPAGVLVFGREAGIHLVRVRPAGSGRPTRLPAPVADGAVWMISLDRAPLEVRGQGGADSPVRGFSARGHVVEAFERPSGSGVRTW